MKQKLLFGALLFFSTITLFAQNTIGGKIEDVAKQPLPYANILLHDANDSENIKGTTSDDEGNYSFKNIPNGKYHIEVSMIGYTTKKSEPFELSSHKTLHFTMSEETQSLGEMEINTKPTIRQTAEKLIVDIEKSPMVNTNLQDVVKKVPGIIATNGKISYGGQQGITILINGKTTNYIDTETLLRDFPADNIARVELIQQPGSEYDAEGSGPILNIILKKNVSLGTHGNVKVNTGYDNEIEYGSSASISSFKNKINWQASAAYRKSAWREDLQIIRRVASEESEEPTVFDQFTESPYHPRSFRFSGGIDYYIHKFHSIGVSGRRTEVDSDRSDFNKTFITENNQTNGLFTQNDYERKRKVFNINPYYEFDDKKNKLVADFNYVKYDNNNMNTLFDTGSSSVFYDDQRYFQDGKYDIQTYKIDYKREISEDSNWMVGSKYSMVNTDSDLKSFLRDADGNFIFQPDQSNRFIVDEDIFALYGKVNLKLDKWHLTAGLRWEDSKTSGTSKSNNETRTRNISKLFPSASVSRKIAGEIGANLSYSYRIQRPSYNSLNTFVYYYDPYAFEEGNPNLKPSFTNSFQFNLTYDNQPFFSVGYRNTKDALFEFISQNDETSQISRSMINLAERENWNFRLFAPLNFAKGLEGYTGVILDYNRFMSDKLVPKLDIDKWSFTWYTSIEYKLPWDIHSELTGYYNSGSLEGQIDIDWVANLSFALSKKFMDGKLKAYAGIDDILNRKVFGDIMYKNIDANIVSDWSRQKLYFQLTYNFGTKYNKKKNRGNSSQDEQNRINSNN
ncbi:TonB-dependent receptor domain-containing protein [Aureivirga sp. CE67]|uniref:TonB-dependent receptor domain-containing protein n=1 Tax=Aureivirga sp. CE67 TaxID=1788983 RepID=UPI0018C97D72|nr:TonB-dependent receptor [Aureivirga sp. CE67]